MKQRRRWWLYALSCADDTIYAGITTNLARRLHAHNFTKRGAKYTRARRPVRLVAAWPMASKSSALKTEHKFKKRTRASKLEAIKNCDRKCPNPIDI